MHSHTVAPKPSKRLNVRAHSLDGGRPTDPKIRRIEGAVETIAILKRQERNCEQRAREDLRLARINEQRANREEAEARKLRDELIPGVQSSYIHLERRA